MEREQGPSFSDSMRTLWRGLPLAATVAILAATIVFFLSRSQPPVYQATAALFTSQSDADIRIPGVAVAEATPLAVELYREALLSRPVLERAETIAENRGQQIAFADLPISVSTEEFGTAELLHIRISGPSREQVVQAGDALTQALIAWDRQRMRHALVHAVETIESQLAALDRAVDDLTADGTEEPQQQLNALLEARGARFAQLHIARGLQQAPGDLLNVLHASTATNGPVSPRPMRDALLALALGIAVSYGILALNSALIKR